MRLSSDTSHCGRSVRVGKGHQMPKPDRWVQAGRTGPMLFCR